MPSRTAPTSSKVPAGCISVGNALRKLSFFACFLTLTLPTIGCARQERRELEQSFHVMRAVQFADAAERDARSSARNVEDIRANLSAADLALTDARIARLSAERARAEAFSRMRSRK